MQIADFTFDKPPSPVAAVNAADGVNLCWVDENHAQMLVPPYINQVAGHIHDFLDKPPSGTRNPR